MSKYLRIFETVADYTAAENTLAKPNVSLIEETNKVEYNPYVPPRNDIIIYTASEKLVEVTSQFSSGLHTNAFNTTIKSHTFENGVGTIEFDDNVTSIGLSAFYGCSNLTSITIPNSVTSIGYMAFSECTSLPVEDNIRYADTCAVGAVDKTLSAYAIKEGTRFIGSDAFENCSNLTSITIPNSVTSIGLGAFWGCTNLKSVTIPNSVTTIGTEAFHSCSGLTSVTIPNTVTNIGDYAFYNCSSLTSVTIPDSVTSIGTVAFQSCSSLKSVTVEATTPPTLEYREGRYGQFNNNASGRKIYVPAASVNTYKTASGWSNYANDIEAIPTT